MATDVKTLYPAQYYASYDTAAAQPAHINGWYDTWNMSDVSAVPTASDMIAVTEAQWMARNSNQGVQNGAIVACPAPVPVPTVSLAAQAQSALTAASAATWQAYGMYGETTPADVVTYLKALHAIANGTDTTSTALPVQPTDVMAAATS
ncbi:hypothetical protein GOB86_13605 [Acetobacter lambici]|uniref:Uncharacterized protein n=1 Tax=Acetobacter lambici TaxID=1332824 RepID=A0ABT1F4R5_9PROT|nr:hypothetical protein [Acetobacter lambici]MCP1243843.1 hypothetical protein [Acetobacter lambici]MCP1259951.1 hypothetical protein [Acetobacter lambici]NHO58066.1 hypothetical protein [Acetobacter lambici]